MYYIIYGLFVMLLVTMCLWIYHNIQYYRKRKDSLISAVVLDRHDAKSQAYLMASLGLAFPICLLTVLMFYL